MGIIIRKGTLADVPEAHELVRELAAYEHEEHEFIATLEEYQRDFQEGLFELLVAEKDGKIAGIMLHFMMYSSWKARMLYLDDFVVKEAYRRQGIGQLLYNRLFEIAKERKCRLVKWQVLDWNEPAVNFYKKNNATIEKNWWNVKVVF